jgi:hypothetical protein
MTNLNSSYAADMTSYGFSTGDSINASDLDQFVGNLAGAISGNRSNTVTVTEYYCHSNCHSNCHGSI